MAMVELSIKVNGEHIKLLQQVKQPINALDIINTPEGLTRLIKEPQAIAN